MSAATQNVNGESVMSTLLDKGGSVRAHQHSASCG
jgi:hypothetical protein